MEDFAIEFQNFAEQLISADNYGLLICNGGGGGRIADDALGARRLCLKST